MGRCAARPAVRGGAPSLSSVAELVGGCGTTGGSRQQSSGEPTRCPTSAGTRCDGRRRLPLQPLLQRPSLPGAWARSDSAACRPQRRCCAGGGRGHAGLDQRLPLKLRRKSTDLADVLRFNFTSWHQLKACPAQIAHFVHGIRILAICSCGGILQICQWYRVCDAGALRAEPLGHPYILRGQNREE